MKSLLIRIRILFCKWPPYGPKEIIWITRNSWMYKNPLSWKTKYILDHENTYRKNIKR